MKIKAALILIILLISNVCLAQSKKAGVQVDFGIPDGINAGLTYKPISWSRLYFTGSHNLMSFGVRSGLSLEPFNATIAPTLQLEVGGYWRGKFFLIENSPELSYIYSNLNIGVDIGNSNSWKLFIHGGPTYISGTIYSINEIIKLDSAKISELKISGFAVPSIKIGFYIYL
jgi:hypothetical protein